MRKASYWNHAEISSPGWNCWLWGSQSPSRMDRQLPVKSSWHWTINSSFHWVGWGWTGLFSNLLYAFSIRPVCERWCALRTSTGLSPRSSISFTLPHDPSIFSFLPSIPDRLFHLRISEWISPGPEFHPTSRTNVLFWACIAPQGGSKLQEASNANISGSRSVFYIFLSIGVYTTVDTSTQL